MNEEEKEFWRNYYKLEKEYEDLKLAYGLYKDTADKLQKENKKLKKESQNSMEARNRMAQEVFRLQKEVKEKDKKWIDRINDSIIAYELSERIDFDKPDNSKIIKALKKLLEGE